MKLSRCILGCSACLTLLPFAVRAQENPAAEASANRTSGSVIPLKLQVLLTEYDGTKKIASLPYTMSLTATPESKPPGGFTQLRDGVRVPVLTSSKTGENSMQYIDVGTNIDVRAAHTEGERYTAEFRIERSSPSSQPLIRDFRNDFTMELRDAHGNEATVASDPMTGHVLKVEVLLSVAK